MIRSWVWQLTQLIMPSLSSSLPGMLSIHSALVSCRERLRVLRSLMSAVVGAPAAMVTSLGPSRS